MGEIPKADPSSSPRIAASGDRERDRPLLLETGDDWEVRVTPIEASPEGRNLLEGGKPRYVFEVRAEFMGDGLVPFEPAPAGGVKRVELHNLKDPEMAKATGAAAAEALRRGDRDLFLPRIAERFGGEPRYAGPTGEA